MSIGYICKPNERIAIIVWDGLVTLDQWRNHVDKMFADPAYVSLKLQLSDLRFSIFDGSITDEKIREVVDHIGTRQKMFSLSKLAMVAGTDWAKTKLAESLIQMLSITPIVFADLHTACRWLGLDVVNIGRDIQQIRVQLRQEL